jgi:hypothetical protein
MGFAVARSQGRFTFQLRVPLRSALQDRLCHPSANEESDEILVIQTGGQICHSKVDLQASGPGRFLDGFRPADDQVHVDPLA